ncbi:hypothetical protein ACFE04_008191 [Oxalis oulophora]
MSFQLVMAHRRLLIAIWLEVLGVRLALHGVSFRTLQGIIRGVFIKEALESCRISNRQVCVKWWKLGIWFYIFRMREPADWVWMGNNSRCMYVLYSVARR